VRIAAVRDVTDREKTLNLLRESENRLRELVDEVFDLTVLSRDGVVVDLSGPLLDVLGNAREEAIGRPVLEFVAPEAVARTKAVLDQKRAGSYESFIVGRSDEVVPVEIIAIYATVDGKPTRIAGMRDLRERNRREEERQRLQRQMARMSRLDGLGALAGGIAHDFNNLLIVVMGNAELMALRHLDPDTREKIEAILTAGQQARQLTQRLLSYAGQQEEEENEAFDLGELTHELTRMLAKGLPSNIQLDVFVDPGCEARGNRTSFTRVLLNLFSNASEALGRGPGAISVRVTRLSEPDTRWDDSLGEAVGPGDWIMIEVQDTGSGMDDDTAARTIDPFFTTQSEGHGLGLSATLGIVRAHRGALHLETDPGKGSKFSVIIPTDGGADSAKPTSTLAKSIRRPRVLVVDDEPLIRRQMRRILLLRGYEVVEAQDGEACLEEVKVSRPDMVVLDVSLGGTGGAEVVRLLRQRGDTFPIVLTSGRDYSTAELALDADAFQGFLRKPYGIDELVGAVEDALKTTDTPSRPLRA
jgi:PAS domain S-box-containing protein